MRSPAFVTAPVLTLSLCLGACAKTPPPLPRATALPSWESPPRGPDDAVVARVAGVAIHASEVRRQATAAGKDARAALDDLVALELLAQKARARGWAADARARDEVKRAKMQLMLEREFEARHRMADLPDDILRPFYDKAIDLFQHPRLVHCAGLTFYAFPHLGPERRAQSRRHAHELMTFLATRPDKGPDDFGVVAGLPQWKEKNVSYTRPWQSHDRPMTPTVGAAVMKMHNVGDTTGLIEDENGFHVLRYISERSPKDEPFEVARHDMRKEYFPTWRKDTFKKKTDAMMTATGSDAFPDRVFRREFLGGS